MTLAPIQDRTLSLSEVLEISQPTLGPVDTLPSRVEVLVVGAGPAGLTAANLLGAYGVNTLVVERSAETSGQPKAIVMDDEFLRALDGIGVAERLRGHTSPPFGIYFISPLGHPLVKVPGFITPNGFGNRNAVSQPVVEKVLLEAARERSTVAITYGCELQALTQGDDGVEVELSQDGRTHRVAADFVLACDGARSTIRGLLDVPFEGKRLNQPHLVVDLAEFPDQSPYSRFFCNPRRPLNSIPGPYGGRRVEFMLMPGDDPETIATPSSTAELFKRHTPYDHHDLKVIRSAVYAFSERIAARLAIGRIFLAGDAAHTMPPFGAQGMNSGARDVVNLCWKLHAVLRGHAQMSILESYELERRPHIEAIVRYSVAIGRLANVRSRSLALVRDAFFTVVNLAPPVRRWFAEMRYMPKPRLRKGLVVIGDSAGPLAGRPFPRVQLTTADGTTAPLDALIGRGHALVGVGVDAVTVRRELAHPVFASLPHTALALGWRDAPKADGDVVTARVLGDAAPALRRHDGELLIVRPDRYIAVAARPEAFASAAARYAASLGVTPTGETGPETNGS